MQYTYNYKFKLPDQDDEFNISDFNENSIAFDRTLKETVDSVGDMTSEAKQEIEAVAAETLESANTAKTAANTAKTAADTATTAVAGIDTKISEAETAIDAKVTEAESQLDTTIDTKASAAVNNYIATQMDGLKLYRYSVGGSYTYSITVGNSTIFETDGYKDCSIAVGDANNISYCSIAAGMNNNATYNSLVAGYGNRCGANASVVGNENVAGNAALVAGTGNIVSNLAAAIGDTNKAGKYSLLLGQNNTAVNSDSTTYYNYCTIIGQNNTANGVASILLGSSNTVSSVGIAAGQNNTAADYSALFGSQNNFAGANYSLATGYANTSTSEYSVAVGRENTLSYQHEYVFGNGNTLSGFYNLVIGSTNTTTKGTGGMNVTTFILGSGNTVKANKYGYCNFVIGVNNNLFGNSNFAFGTGNTIGKDDSNSTNNCSSVVFGSSNKVALLTNYGGNALVKGDLNETGGMSVIGKNNKLAYALDGLAIGRNHTTDAESSGMLGISMLVGQNLQLNTSATNTASNDYTQQTLIVGVYNNSAKQGFITVGNGNSSARNNVFRVAKDGTTYLKTTQTAGADYAEMFEYVDGNVDGEDRRGLIVALDGEKIKLADSETDIDDVIGIVSVNPSVVGDAQGENWNEKYLKDVFGQTIYEDVEIPEHTETRPTYDEFGNVTGEEEIVIEAKVERQPKLNPDFDATKKYVAREDRKEWAAVGLVGKLIVLTDGTVKVNKYVRPADGGIATLSSEKTNLRVMKIIDDTHALVLVK